MTTDNSDGAAVIVVQYFTWSPDQGKRQTQAKLDLRTGEVFAIGDLDVNGQPFAHSQADFIQAAGSKSNVLVTRIEADQTWRVQHKDSLDYLRSLAGYSLAQAA